MINQTVTIYELIHTQIEVGGASRVTIVDNF